MNDRVVLYRVTERPLQLAVACVAVCFFCHVTANAAPLSADNILPPMARVQSEQVSAAQPASVAHSASGYEVAPTPNVDLLPPRGETSRGTAIVPNFGTLRGASRGDGYTPGSAAHSTQERRRMSLPGVSLKVPLN